MQWRSGFLGDGNMTQPIWDIVVRVCHWSLAVGFVVMYLSGENDIMRIHTYVGYYVVLVLVVRVIWGFIGSKHARFGDFVFAPAYVWAYAKRFVRGQSPRYLGHNPLGGVMVLVLLMMLSVCVISGLMLLGLQEEHGPLAFLVEYDVFFYAEGMVASIHELATTSMLVLVCLHVAGVVISSRMHQENLVSAMWHGRKRGDGKQT